jgi:hypothetical protein
MKSLLQREGEMPATMPSMQIAPKAALMLSF